MAIRKYKPTTPGRRGSSVADFVEVTRSTPEKSLVRPLPKKGGRNNQGRITTRHQGGGHKRAYRVIDFRRYDKDGVPAKVAHIEYDPNRTARIALLHYADGEKRYIIAPQGLGQGTVVVEAAVRSGALNTANWATRLHRVLMGVPGPVTSAPSQGVHELIRSRGAALVTRGEDVLELLSPSGSFLGEVPRAPVLVTDRLSDRERQVLDAVPRIRPAGVDSIARTAGVAVRDVSAAMARLGSLGLVEHTTAGWRRSEPPG